MNKSESIKNIAEALSQFQGEVSKIKKDAANPFFKNNYASLDNIIDEIRPLLAKHNLSLLQIPSGDGTMVGIKTILLHITGEFLEGGELNMKPVKNDPQGIGSCITYARRYSLAAFLNLNTGEDDDGNKASNVQGDPKKESKTETQGNISDKQIKRLYAIAITKNHNSESVKKTAQKKYNVTNLSNLTKANYDELCKGYENL